MKVLFLRLILPLILVVASYSYYKKNNPEYYQRVLDEELRIGEEKITPRLQEFIDDEKVVLSCPSLKKAISYNNFTLVKYMVDSGVDVNCKNYNLDLPVCMMTLANKESPNLKLISYLKNKGCNYSFENNEGENAFHILYNLRSAENMGYRVLRLYIAKLVRLGVDINHQNNKGETPLMYSVLKSADPKNVTTFIKKGANTDLKTSSGSSALGLAISNRKTEIVTLLQAEGAKGYIDGEYIDEEMLQTLNRNRNKALLEKRKKRQLSWSNSVFHWKSYINAYKLDLTCSFRLMGGPGNGGEDIHTNEQMNSSVSMFSQTDAFVFGDCPDWKYYHYRIVSRTGKTYSQGHNLFWHESESPIGSKEALYIALPFDDEFEGTVKWYGSHEQVSDLDLEKAKLKLVKQYAIYVQNRHF
ncbi:ankyrin repeat domain-containing protein [Pseudoalteromonas sp. 31A1]|uniref:ankyrin repeat domain-containing protein n=1 Tax=Pseudoalteromonas sp. 31A1 TaxID=2686351 RepID=UPI0013FD5E08|nr:ankyrin repeat domain-containing protein [Pseudoalteromonas sp. 31A1]